MAWKYYDFECTDCGEVFEEMVQSLEEVLVCPTCACTETIRHMPNTASCFLNEHVKKAASLKKRSEEHTKAEQRKGNLPSMRDYPQFVGKKGW